MRILITHPSMRRPGGLQTFTRQTARALRDLGHEVLGYRGLLEHGESLETDPDFPVWVDGAWGGCEPDIIHGQHHVPAMAALLDFPRSPAIFHCHGATWRDRVFTHPRIGHYLAMSTSLAERITIESGLDPARVGVHLNAVDTASFRPVRDLPKQPHRVLVYHGRLNPDHPSVRAIHQACGALGMEMELAGAKFGRAVQRPAQMLPHHDIVFASGISALEAMACGCSVVILGRSSCGPMVGCGNFDTLRNHNFSIADNSPPPTVEAVIAAIRNYDPAAAGRVTRRVRAEAGLEDATRRMVGWYEKAIAWHRENPPGPQAERNAVAVFLRQLAPLVHATGPTGLAQTHESP